MGNNVFSGKYALLSLSLSLRYVLFVSGWNLGSSSCDQLSVDMMVDYVTGQLGGAKVCAIITYMYEMISAYLYLVSPGQRPLLFDSPGCIGRKFCHR